jgi:hypothetical protein
MQTLVFNSTLKTVKVYEETQENSNIIYSFKNISTVKPKEEGYYEVVQKEQHEEGLDKSYPIARFPISNTNMIIEK